ncbi:MAG: energy transducer TonB, partial [Flavobacteriales bacterium]
ESERQEQARIDRENRLKGGLDGGGGSSGTGGGSGGGNGGGTGPGEGDGNGDGTGGGSGGGDGSGRVAVFQPDCGKDAEEKGWVEVRVTLRADGSVEKAKAMDSSAFSNVSKFRQLAEKCAKEWKFNTGPAGQTEIIKIKFTPK